ncbi:hypothetical protein ABEB36_014169 [Hypothenemus hampei]|uniref:BESS domain-containing protein n=1 Tax=Hypothenemus hampei TaxID=57062 RepID=A0ABD1E843_HYPHA
MKFYEQYTKRRRTFTTTKQICEGSDLSQPSSSFSISPQAESEEDFVHSQSVHENTTSKQTEKKSMDNLEDILTTAKKICNSVAQPKQKTSNEAFGAYLVSRLEEMSPNTSTEVRKKLIRIIEDIEN